MKVQRSEQLGESGGFKLTINAGAHGGHDRYPGAFLLWERCIRLMIRIHLEQRG